MNTWIGFECFSCFSLHPISHLFLRFLMVCVFGVHVIQNMGKPTGWEKKTRTSTPWTTTITSGAKRCEAAACERSFISSNGSIYRKPFFQLNPSVQLHLTNCTIQWFKEMQKPSVKWNGSTEVQATDTSAEAPAEHWSRPEGSGCENASWTSVTCQRCCRRWTLGPPNRRCKKLIEKEPKSSQTWWWTVKIWCSFAEEKICIASGDSISLARNPLGTV